MHMLTRPDCDCAFNHSKSQYAEDLIMLPTLLHARRGSPGHGVFVEPGALDGIAFSNTYMLERCFGWRGLLIEGNPASFAKLRESGRASTFLHSAVCGASDPPFVEFTVDGGPVAGQVGQLTRGHQHIEFTLRWTAHNLCCLSQQLVCGFAHRTDHNNDLITGFHSLSDSLGNGMKRQRRLAG